METVRQWALGLSMSAIFGAVIMALSPKGSLQKSVRAAVSLFLLLAMLSPFVRGLDFSFVLNGLETPQASDGYAMRTAAARQMKEAAEERVTEILISKGINGASVNIDISVDEENQMTVERVEVVAAAEFAGLFTSAEQAIFDELGIRTEIEVEQ